MSYLCGAAKWMPLILCMVTPASILLTYGIAVYRDHVSALWPYISDTGTKPPESCIFGLLLSAVSFLLCVIIYIRYRQVSEWVKLTPSVGITAPWNRAASCCGFISALGLHMVANFQELNEFTTHIVGAMMCFFSATVYFFLQFAIIVIHLHCLRSCSKEWLQPRVCKARVTYYVLLGHCVIGFGKTVFTRKMHPDAKRMLWLRIVLTFLNVLFIVGTFAPVGPAMKEFTGKDILKWTVNDGGFLYHAMSTFSEWLLVLSFCAYICTLFWEFREIEIEPPQIKFIRLKESTETESEEIDQGTAKGLWI